jgi:hypothetical protein
MGAPPVSFGRHSALLLLHDRHPRVIDAPDEGAVDLELLHLEFFTFQDHVCDLLDRRREKRARRCFETIHRLLVEGDREIRTAVCDHFVTPHLIFHADLAWAQGLMPPLLAELCARMHAWAEETFGSDRRDDRGG